MTIFAVVYVPEGIAIATDSRLTEKITYSNGMFTQSVLSDEENKLFSVRNKEVAIVYSSEMESGFKMPEFISRFDREIASENDSVRKLSDKLLEHIADEEVLIETLVIAGYEDEEQVVLVIQNNILKQVNGVNNKYGVTWGGQIEPFNKIQIDNPFYYEGMNLENATELATFIVNATINYHNLTPGYSDVGGQVKIANLDKKGLNFLN